MLSVFKKLLYLSNRKNLKLRKMENLNTILAGSTLVARSICDSNCIWTAKVLTRKGSFITALIDGEIVRKKVKIFRGEEYALLLGSYSMAPTFKVRA